MSDAGTPSRKYQLIGADGMRVGDGSSSVIGGAPSGTVLLSSDWSQGIGTSDALLIESNKPHGWDQAGGSGTPKRITVVSAAGHGMPAGMANCLRVEHPVGGQNYGMVQKFWSMPAVGEVNYYRWYYRNEAVEALGSLGGGYHPLETPRGPGDFGTDGELVWKNNSRADGTFGMFIEGQNGYNQRFLPGLNARTNPTYLTKSATWRFELKITRVASGSPYDTASWDMRIYNESVSSVVPAFDRNNIWYYDFNGGVNEGTIAAGYGQAVQMLSNGFTGITVGTNGGDWSPSYIQYEYWAGFRIMRGGDWIGPYVPGES